VRPTSSLINWKNCKFVMKLASKLWGCFHYFKICSSLSQVIFDEMLKPLLILLILFASNCGQRRNFSSQGGLRSIPSTYFRTKNARVKFWWIWPLCMVWVWDSSFRLYHRFRLTKLDDYFWISFDNFWSKHCFLGSWGRCENWLKLKPNYRK
jgi:hypothetical protein